MSTGRKFPRTECLICLQCFKFPPYPNISLKLFLFTLSIVRCSCGLFCKLQPMQNIGAHLEMLEREYWYVFLIPFCLKLYNSQTVIIIEWRSSYDSIEVLLITTTWGIIYLCEHSYCIGKLC